MSRRLLLAFAAATLSLGGCVSLLPQSKPAQLYELSPDLKAGAGGAPAGSVNVRLDSVLFQQAAAGDRMLTVRDGAAAYIAGARWVSPAQTLFDEDLPRAFAQHASTVRLISHGDPASAQLSLLVDVERFQVRLSGGQPTVETTIRARLIRYPQREIVLDRTIEASQTADAERVSSIVRAYDAALGHALSTLVETTDQAAAAR